VGRTSRSGVSGVAMVVALSLDMWMSRSGRWGIPVLAVLDDLKSSTHKHIRYSFSKVFTITQLLD
jgi:hypothetical protein